MRKVKHKVPNTHFPTTPCYHGHINYNWRDTKRKSIDKLWSENKLRSFGGELKKSGHLIANIVEGSETPVRAENFFDIPSLFRVSKIENTRFY